MTYFQSILLGLVQGLGEFLPISSSAHLVIMPWFVKFQDPGLAFDVALHLGTLFAVMAFFWKDWWRIGQGSVLYVLSRDADKRKMHYQSFFLLIALVLATIPAAIAGILLDNWAETVLRHPLIVAVNMIVFGGLLWLADRLSRGGQTIDQMTIKWAIYIGLAQCLALFPGTSRSGVTMTAALALGFNRSESARFSFLMATPIIFGACLLKYKYLMAALTDYKALIGILASAIIGFLSIKYLLKLVQHYSYAVFAYYRLVFGVGVIVIYLLRM